MHVGTTGHDYQKRDDSFEVFCTQKKMMRTRKMKYKVKTLEKKSRERVKKERERMRESEKEGKIQWPKLSIPTGFSDYLRLYKCKYVYPDNNYCNFSSDSPNTLSLSLNPYPSTTHPHTHTHTREI